jgi:hypothetical protein
LEFSEEELFTEWQGDDDTSGKWWRRWDEMRNVTCCDALFRNRNADVCVNVYVYTVRVKGVEREVEPNPTLTTKPYF